MSLYLIVLKISVFLEKIKNNINTNRNNCKTAAHGGKVSASVPAHTLLRKNV